MKYLLFSSLLFLLSPNREENAVILSENIFEVLCSGKVVGTGMSYECIDSLELIGTCYGYVNCSACKTCEYCRYCNNGGSCGVCLSKVYNKKISKFDRISKRNLKRKSHQVTSKSNFDKHNSNISRITRKEGDRPEPLYSESIVNKVIVLDIIRNNNVNMRELPTINSKVVLILARNTKVEILGKSIQRQLIKGYGRYHWIKVKKENKEGWIFEPLIAIRSNEISKISVIAFQHKTITGGNVNIRSTPSILSKVLFQLNSNSRVEILKQSNKKQSISDFGEHFWYFINYKGKEGWVFGGLLE